MRCCSRRWNGRIIGWRWGLMVMEDELEEAQKLEDHQYDMRSHVVNLKH
jgi:hypothetical protein